jgi:hypothetical protein
MLMDGKSALPGNRGLPIFRQTGTFEIVVKERQILYREAVKQQSPGSAAQRRHPGLPDESDLYANGVAPNVV